MQANMGWNYYIHFIKRLLSIVLNPAITRLFVITSMPSRPMYLMKIVTLIF